MKADNKKIKIHQLPHLIAAYEELSHEREFLEKIAEFVARYRLFIMKRTFDSYESNLMVQDLNQMYIGPIILALKNKYLLRPARAQIRIDCIQKILNKMVESLDHNDTWVVSLFVAAYRQPWKWPPHRDLMEEIPIHNIKMRTKKYVFRSSAKKNPQQFRQSLLNNTVWITVNKRHKYLETYMPHDFNRYLHPKRFLLLSSLLIVFALCVKFIYSEDNFSAVITLLMAPFLWLGQSLLYTLLNARLPSYLDLGQLPGSLGSGLLTELKENIDEEMAILKMRIPAKKNIPVAAEVETKVLFKSFPQPTVFPCSSNTDDLFPAPVKTKQKTHSNQPSLNLFLAAAPIIYTLTFHRHCERSEAIQRINILGLKNYD